MQNVSDTSPKNDAPRLFKNPHETWKSIELSSAEPDEPDTQEQNILDIPPDADLNTALDQLPETLFNKVCELHGVDPEDPSSARRSLSRRLTDEEVIRELLTEYVPRSARDLLRHLLDRDGVDLHRSLMKEFSGDREHALWMSEKAPRFRVSRLHETGLQMISVRQKQAGDIVLELIPEDLQVPLANVLEDDPPCNVSFDLEDDVYPTVTLPPSSFFDEMEEHLQIVHERLEEGIQNTPARAIFADVPRNLFITVLTLVQVLNRKGFSSDDRKKLCEGFLSFRSGEVHDHPDLLPVVEALLFSIDPDRWIVGYEETDRLRMIPERTLIERLDTLGLPPIYWEEFVVGDFEPVLLTAAGTGSRITRRAGVLVGPVLNTQSEPVETALRWLEKKPDEGHPRPEQAAAGVISWVKRNHDSLNEDEIRQLLNVGFSHASSTVRKSSLIGMDRLTEDLLQEVLPQALEDRAETVRDWAEKKQDGEDASAEGQLPLFD